MRYLLVALARPRIGEGFLCEPTNWDTTPDVGGAGMGAVGDGGSSWGVPARREGYGGLVAGFKASSAPNDYWCASAPRPTQANPYNTWGLPRFRLLSADRSGEG